jgi:hypothetical protein
MSGKYIFVTGAPGSRWSGYVEDHLYIRDDLDKTDMSSEREYWRGRDGCRNLMHRGAYFDPGMEFRNEQKYWDEPFSGEGIRVIKSHTFAYHLPYLTDFGCPIHLIYRTNQECFDWWHQAGGWNITYPNYQWYRDDENMIEQIQMQNLLIKEFAQDEGLEKHNDGSRDYYIWMPKTENG